MAQHERPPAPELQGRPAVLAILVVLAALLAGSWWGWSYAGPLGGLLGVLLGAALGTLAFTLIRARASAQRFADRPAPDLRALPPDQALRVLTAILNGAGPTGGLLGDIAQAQAQAQAGQLDAALASLRALAVAHPHAPAVPATITRMLAGSNAHQAEHRAAAHTALRLALRGGMNRLAAQLFAELDPNTRASLELEPVERARLDKAMRARPPWTTS